MSADTVKSAEAEVQKLLDTRIIREVQYPVWVANVVMVPKKNGNMRMCIDFTELNKACPKDPYPLPRIDVIIDQAAGCDMLSLLDCFSGYHQVWMRREDKAKTGFTTPFRHLLLCQDARGPTQRRVYFQPHDEADPGQSAGA
jgi:hypothetical protein